MGTARVWVAGQRQLLSVARILLRRPRIVCLDEATAHVSGPTQFISSLLSQQLVTVLIIAHRLPSVRGCTHTAVFSAGRLVEHGRTEHLLSNPDSLLSEMYRHSSR